MLIFISGYKMLIDTIYLSLMHGFRVAHRSESDSNFRKFLHIVVHLQIFLQNLSLLWTPSLTLSEWPSYQNLWKVLAYPSLDSLLADLSLLIAYLLASVIVLGLIFSLIILLVMLTYFDKEMPYLLRQGLRLLLFLFSYLYFIPTTIVLSILLKYSDSSANTIAEYYNTISANQFNYGNIGFFVAVILLGLHLGFGLIYECFSIETKHFLAGMDSGAKSTAKYDLIIKILTFTRCLLYTFVADLNYPLYLFVLSLLYVIGAMLLLYYLPNYSNFMNFLKIQIQLGSCIGGLIFLLGYLLNNATVIFALIVFVEPAVSVLLFNTISYRIEKITPLRQCFTPNFFEFELSARNTLVTGELQYDILKIMNKNYKISNDKCNLVMQAHYCGYILDQHMLGLLKISRINHYGSDIPTNFQVFKCKEELQAICLKTSDGFQLYNYLRKLRKSLEADKYLCKELLVLNERFIDKHSSLTTLKACVTSFDKTLKIVKEQYKELLKENPESKVCLEMYATLLNNILGEGDQARILVDRKNTIKRKPIVTGKKSLQFDESSCVLIISGDKSNVGKILYANPSAMKMLNSTYDQMQEAYLSNFVPKPYDKNHDERLLKFIENTDSHHIFRSAQLFLATTDEYLVECYFNSECIGYEGENNFLSLIEPIHEKKREVALVSREGFIYSHSRNMPRVLCCTDRYLEGRYLVEFFPDLNFEIMPANRLFICDLRVQDTGESVEIGMIIKEKTVSKVTFLTIYISSNTTQIERWKIYDANSGNADFDERNHSRLLKVVDESEEKLRKSEIKQNKPNPRAKLAFQNCENENENSEKIVSVSHTSSSTKSKNLAEIKYLKKGLLSLNHMKYLVLFSVIIT